MSYFDEPVTVPVTFMETPEILGDWAVEDELIELTHSDFGTYRALNGIGRVEDCRCVAEEVMAGYMPEIELEIFISSALAGAPFDD